MPTVRRTMLALIASTLGAGAFAQSWPAKPLVVRYSTIGAAAMDATPRVKVSPHTGGVTADAYVKMGVAAARNAQAVLQR